MSVDARPKRRRSIENDDLKDGGGDGGGGMEGGGGNGGGQQPQRSGGGSAPAPSGGKKAAASAAVLADPTAVVKAEGTWNYTLESPQGGEGTLTIVKDGEAYSGTIMNKRFNKESPLSVVEVKGNALSFQYEAPGRDGTPMQVQVKSIISGDALTGEMSVGQFGTFPIKATRAQ